MTQTELWLSYHQRSRCDKPSASQLIELEFANQKLADLEDVLDHLFAQGFVEAKYRSLTWWEKHEGHKIGGSTVVEELLNSGIGKCPESALRLVIADRAPAVWFSYEYVHNPNEIAASQRIKLDGHEKLELIGHLTNYVFKHGYLSPELRSRVYWKGSCGTRLEECARLDDLLFRGDGVTETKGLRLVIDHTPVLHVPARRICA